MTTPAIRLCSAALASLLAAAPALAQPSGLRLGGGNEGFSLRGTDNGLHLRLSTLTTPDSTSAPVGEAGRQTLRADWPVFGYGLRTSLGLSWNAAGRSGLSGTSDLAPSTFLGFGWRGEPVRNSRWSLSAEVGTSLASGTACHGSSMSCAMPRAQGLSGEASGNGLRLSPYVSFGATWSFDR